MNWDEGDEMFDGPQALAGTYRLKVEFRVKVPDRLDGASKPARDKAGRSSAYENWPVNGQNPRFH